MSDTDLSSRIRQRREQLGLSQEELAARMGYRSKSSITKLEKGINDLPRAKLEELAAALDPTPAWLMGLVDLPFPPPGFEHRVLHRRPRRMARRLRPHLPWQQHGPHHL